MCGCCTPFSPADSSTGSIPAKPTLHGSPSFPKVWQKPYRKWITCVASPTGTRCNSVEHFWVMSVLFCVTACPSHQVQDHAFVVQSPLLSPFRSIFHLGHQNHTSVKVSWSVQPYWPFFNRQNCYTFIYKSASGDRSGSKLHQSAMKTLTLVPICSVFRYSTSEWWINIYRIY